jgi:two-component system alkaline phosphatase synthesis response regulator PhoP
MAWEQVDWKKLRGVSKPKLMELASCDYLDRGEDVVLAGPHSGETSEMSFESSLTESGEFFIIDASDDGCGRVRHGRPIMPERAWEAVMAKQILLVDDDRNTAKYLSAVLSDNGYDPILAYDGSEGLAKVKQSTPDLIVLDVMMPKKTGFVLFKQLKEDKRYRDIPILMLSGVSGVLQELEDHKEETFERPYDNLREALKQKIQEMREVGSVRPEMFLDKPVEPDSFIAKVRQLIGN